MKTPYKFTATPNYSKRTYTLRFNTGGSITKYRTHPMIEEEFNEAWYYTENDWKAEINKGNVVTVK